MSTKAPPRSERDSTEMHTEFTSAWLSTDVGRQLHLGEPSSGTGGDR